MSSNSKVKTRELTEHFFRSEYGKMVSVLTKYVGAENVETAEDIVQETLLKAVDFWQHHGIPNNPQAWLYATAKNLTINTLKKKKHQVNYQDYVKRLSTNSILFDDFEITDKGIVDEQLKMMFVCCHPSISENSQIALMLKILCGFSMAEIANAFFTSKETINKRLVRGRKKLKEKEVNFELPSDINGSLPIVLKAVYLLFNEGYSPTQLNEVIRFDLCLEAIRLTEILIASEAIEMKSDCYSLLALMLLNAARFEARHNESNEMIEMDKQDRTLWNQELINRGIHSLDKAIGNGQISTYLILATISANHCIASNFDNTNWVEILSLYDSLITLNDTPIVKLNRIVALAKVEGNRKAIHELELLESHSSLQENHLFHSTLGMLLSWDNQIDHAKTRFRKAISLTENKRDIKMLEKKLLDLVPI